MKRTALLLVLVGVVAVACWSRAPDIQDDAMILGLTPEDFPELEADVFAGMDRGADLSPDEIIGRNTWNTWTAGSQVFLDWLAREGYGISDTLKLLDSRNRSSRFEDLGLINEPGFETAAKPDEFGIWLDVPTDGGRGRIDRMISEEGIDDRVYGRSTGVLGLRLYPNPDFDEAARKRWDPKRFYDENDDYSTKKDLVRPYRVGMACGVCHIAPHPLNPPADPNNADWENLASGIGNQYIREGRVFANNLRPPKRGKPSSFLWEMVNVQPPGTSDTSRMATDHINNPNTINAIFNLPDRLAVATANGMEKMSTETQYLPGDSSNPRHVPHVLKDGADSVGVPGATIRVYVNIGLFSQQWLELHKPLVGVKYQERFSVAKAQKNSVYWRATENRLTNVAKFLSALRPYHLADARWSDESGAEHSGREFIDESALANGGRVFAENCAQCHSSKRPPAGMDLDSDEAHEWFRQSVASSDFRVGNFLSEDVRHSIAKIKTNAGRALATNAKRGQIWDNFSSEDYKNLPAVKRISVYNPITGKDNDYLFDLEKRGVRHSVGYYRTPSLISVWTSAPLLHNNALGEFTGDPSVAGRLRAFEDAMEKLLWPAKREGLRSIWRTQHPSALEIPISYLPKIVQAKVRLTKDLIENNEKGDDVLRLGPIPAGTPINLLASLDLSLGSLKDAKKAIHLVELGVKIKKTLLHLKLNKLEGEEARAYMKSELVESLLENSKCPDLVTDRGHYFGESLPDADKRDLIEFLKTL